MRFKDYILESGFSEGFDEKEFNQRCQFYFNAMEGHLDKFLYHGTNRIVNAGEIVEFKPRGKPKDSPLALHNQANDFFEKQFGRPFRDGLFVSGSNAAAMEFGNKVSIIIPAGKFEWLHSPTISDLTGIYDFAEEDHGNEKDSVTAVMSMITNAKWIHNENLPACLSGGEVMLWCPNGFYTFTKLNLPSGLK